MGRETDMATKLTAKGKGERARTPRRAAGIGPGKAGEPPAIPAIGDSQATVTAEERHGMIERAAYLRAERRGFQGGSALEDWLAAEAEIDRQLGAPRTD
jgi:hypothetical protein